MSDQSKIQHEAKELRIDDLPPRAVEPEEEDATKGGYSSGLSAIGILDETVPKCTYDSGGNCVVDGT